MTGPLFGQAAESAGLDDVATMQLVDINTWLPGDILVKADRRRWRTALSCARRSSTAR